jgi:hypothetical protein
MYKPEYSSDSTNYKEPPEQESMDLIPIQSDFALLKSYIVRAYSDDESGTNFFWFKPFRVL